MSIAEFGTEYFMLLISGNEKSFRKHFFMTFS